MYVFIENFPHYYAHINLIKQCYMVDIYCELFIISPFLHAILIDR